ncbi:cytochrome P450 family protein [Ceratobasidium sp. AG-Ba]|nr:cytochrome P450 family protein [Ceratobasidium sp. AG-Ba]
MPLDFSYAVAYGPHLLIFACLLTVCALKLWNRYSSRKFLPPSPPQHFIWGNRDLMSKPHLGVALSRGHGDILTLVTPTETVVVLNTIEAATEILEKQSAATANRPSNIMANQIMGWGKTLTFSQHDQRHRRLRRVIGSALNATAVKAYIAQQEETTALLLRSIALNPGGFLKDIHQSVISLIMEIAYGYTVVENDPFLEVTQQAMRYLTMGTMSHFWVNWFPILRYIPSWFPGAGFQRIGQNGRALREKYTQIPFQAVVDSLSNRHTIVPSFTSRMLTEKGPYDESREDAELVKTAAAAFFLAGTTTTSSFIASFTLAMALYPELAKRAQKEIDERVPVGQLPSLEERESLPYVNAFMQEATRMYPPVPLGIPHQATEDVTYQGYRIPKGTVIRSNIWAMLHDECIYTNPPSHLQPKPISRQQPSPRSTQIRLLWAFDISASAELENRVAELGGRDSRDLYRLFEPRGVSIGPLPFKCNIQSRQPDIPNAV